MQTKVKLRIAFFAYGGNSGFPSVICSHLPLMVDLVRLLDNHPCVGPDNWGHLTYSDTPVTMTRNRAAVEAKRDGYDFLMMIDSDNVIDLYKKIENLKGFLASALDFSIPRLQRGLPTVIAAPYCGQPPDPISGGRENIFAFHWELKEHDNPDGFKSLEQYSIQHAAIMAGIQPAAAAATGVILYSVNAFDLLEPPYFRYEWTDKYQTHKGSTEDVQNTRDISMAAIEKYHEDCLFIDWDNWAGHVKPKVVGKPYPTPVDAICPSYRQAVLANHQAGDRLRHADFPVPPPKPKFDPTFPGSKSRLEPEETVLQESAPIPDELPPPRAVVNGRPVWSANDSNREALERYAARQMALQEAEEATPRQHNVIPKEELPKPHVEIQEIGGRPVKQLGFSSNPHDIDYLQKLIRTMEVRLDRPIRVLEIGSWAGASAVAIATAFERPESCLYCVDTWQGSPADQTGTWVQLGAEPKRFFDENTKDLQDRGLIRAFQGESSAVAAMFPNQDLDLILVDSGHSEPEISRDTDCWWRHLGPRGLMLWHDYADQGHPAVTTYIDRKFGDNVVAIPNTHWAFVVKGDIEASREAEQEPTHDHPQEEMRDMLPAAAGGGLPPGAY